MIYGNPFIGIFCKTNDSLTLLPKNISAKFNSACEKILKTEIAYVSIADSDLLGIFTAMNSNGIILPQFTYGDEKMKIKKTGLNVSTIEGRYSAVGNNILVNDKACIINPDIDNEDKKRIEDCFDVEVVRRKIGGYSTVGSTCVVTNNGFLAKNDVKDDEIAFLEEFFKVKGGTGTANMGVSFVGLCIVANVSGFIAGELTSGFELQRIMEALSFI